MSSSEPADQDRIPIKISFLDQKSPVFSFYSTTGMIDDGTDDTSSDCSSRSLRDRNNNKKESLHPSINVDPMTSVTGNENKYYESGDIIKEPTIISNAKDELTRGLVKLTLDSDCESLEKFSELSVNDYGELPLAGRVTAVAKVLGFIIVKPAMPHEFLLNLGSPVFLAKSSRTYVSHREKVGNVIDVFGPTYEPYYCVRPVENGIDLVHEGTPLLYKPDHPSTTFVHIKRRGDNQYTVLYSQEWPSSINHRKGKMSDGGIWSRNASDESLHRQYRRRGSGNRRTFNGSYRNIYQENHHGLRSEARAKHSYFHY